MNASSLLMVTRSRTLGTFRTTTLSEVSSAAAITGSAEFFAPLTATLPRNAFPPLIRNLSIFRSAFFSLHSPHATGHFAHLTKGNPQILPRRLQSLLCLLCRNPQLDRKSTRLNSSHGYISYAVFCLKKKKQSATCCLAT